jgi:translation initiation factor 4G
MIHKVEKKYEVGKVADEEQAKQRQIRAILNKLTPTNFEKLFERVKAVNIDNAATLTGVISQIFDRALMEPTYCEMYVNFGCHVAMELLDFNEDNEKITFKRVLLNKCEEQFERGEREQVEEADEEGQIKQFAKEREEKRVKARRRMLGNIGLIGELYKKKMLTERIMHACIQKFLGQCQDPDGEYVEALCKLMSNIGEMIDHKKAKEQMDRYFERMKTLSNNMNLSSSVRFMLKDAIDLRKNKWQQRRKVEGPKKIKQVHRDAAQKRQAQVSWLDHASSINNSARRAPMDFGPRGSMMLSSPNAQMDGYRGVPPTQDVQSEERQSYEAGLSLSLSLSLSLLDF